MIDAATHGTQSLLQSFVLLLPDPFVAAFIGEQGFFKLTQNGIRDMNIVEDFAEPGFQFFFSKPGQIAFSSVSGAMVVGVTIFLDFRRYRAIVVGTTQQRGKCEVVFPLLGFVVPAKDSLYAVE